MRSKNFQQRQTLLAKRKGHWSSPIRTCRDWPLPSINISLFAVPLLSCCGQPRQTPGLLNQACQRARPSCWGRQEVHKLAAARSSSNHRVSRVDRQCSCSYHPTAVEAELSKHQRENEVEYQDCSIRTDRPCSQSMNQKESVSSLRAASDTTFKQRHLHEDVALEDLRCQC